MPPKKLGMGEEDKLRPHLGSQVALEELWETDPEPWLSTSKHTGRCGDSAPRQTVSATGRLCKVRDSELGPRGSTLKLRIPEEVKSGRAGDGKVRD